MIDQKNLDCIARVQLQIALNYEVHRANFHINMKSSLEVILVIISQNLEIFLIFGVGRAQLQGH